MEMNEPLEPDLIMVFAPVDKRAFGVAVGTALGLAILLATLLALGLDPSGRGKLGLLAEFFFGYSVSPGGSLIGAAWGFFVGFIAGWFTAFVRNLGMAIWLLVVRAKAELRATRDFLDHI